MLRLWKVEANVSKNCGEGITNADEKCSNKIAIVIGKGVLEFNPDMLLQQVNIENCSWDDGDRESC